ncbi:Beta-1,4-N-acetylgalactosaminyltransferase bre-4 [Eumeta japonica]|uniref:Beta-1,4-N-acetylgalactosaminyltransferase n=1 Tax=Eumeta variegata TaxID=151549 RepID=A0A4C1ZNF2_EUMVA|nr:Beta-1,4-N-acetylgalactosaminyltransferase bre-4 [Eumeta japonica]
MVTTEKYIHILGGEEKTKNIIDFIIVNDRLRRKVLDTRVYRSVNVGASDFNRAKLMNVGFAESQRARRGGWQCFVFHDIDLLPLDGRNLYTCPRQPRHMSASVDKLNYRLPYEDIFGGVSAMTLEQFQKVNGFSNKYWGWGGEDDDMFYRLQKMNYHIARYKMSIARYAMLKHKKSSPNPKRNDDNGESSQKKTLLMRLNDLPRLPAPIANRQDVPQRRSDYTGVRASEGDGAPPVHARVGQHRRTQLMGVHRQTAVWRRSVAHAPGPRALAPPRMRLKPNRNGVTRRRPPRVTSRHVTAVQERSSVDSLTFTAPRFFELSASNSDI